MDGNIKKKKEILLMINKIKNSKVRGELRRDYLNLLELYEKRDKLDKLDKIKKYDTRFKSFKIH